MVQQSSRLIITALPLRAFFLHFCSSCFLWYFVLFAGCPSVQQCAMESVSRFLVSPIMLEVVNIVTMLANDTTVKVFERVRWVLKFLDNSLGEVS